MFSHQKTGFRSDRDEGKGGPTSESTSLVSPKTMSPESLGDENITHNSKLGGPYSAFSSWKTNLNLESTKQLLGSGVDKMPSVNEYSKHWLGDHSSSYPLGTHSLGTQGLPMPPVFAGISKFHVFRNFSFVLNDNNFKTYTLNMI